MADASADFPGDPHNLDRFVRAQAGVFELALSEIASGRKRSHWMWFIFPQFAGLGSSATSRLFAINSIAEARAYLAHPLLGTRLTQCAQAAMGIEGKTAREIFGSPDEMKLHSSATLFAQVSREGSVFHRLLDKYFQGEPDARTLQLLQAAAAGRPG